MVTRVSDCVTEEQKSSWRTFTKKNILIENYSKKPVTQRSYCCIQRLGEKTFFSSSLSDKSLIYCNMTGFEQQAKRVRNQSLDLCLPTDYRIYRKNKILLVVIKILAI